MKHVFSRPHRALFIFGGFIRTSREGIRQIMGRRIQGSVGITDAVPSLQLYSAQTVSGERDSKFGLAISDCLRPSLAYEMGDSRVSFTLFASFECASSSPERSFSTSSRRAVTASPAPAIMATVRCQ